MIECSPNYSKSAILTRICLLLADKVRKMLTIHDIEKSKQITASNRGGVSDMVSVAKITWDGVCTYLYLYSIFIFLDIIGTSPIGIIGTSPIGIFILEIYKQTKNQ